MVIGIENTKQFFDRSTSALEEKDSSFAPKPDMFNVAQQVAHAAQTIDWFVDGAFGGKGFNEDFAAMETEVRRVSSLKAAREWWDRACSRAMREFGSRSMEELMKPLPPGIMEGMPVMACVQAMADHSAHHRGALTVYARLLGKVSPMPYM